MFNAVRHSWVLGFVLLSGCGARTCCPACPPGGRSRRAGRHGRDETGHPRDVRQRAGTQSGEHHGQGTARDVERGEGQGSQRPMDGPARRHRLRRSGRRRRQGLRRHQQRHAARSGHQGRPRRRDVLRSEDRQLPLADHPRQTGRVPRRRQVRRRLDAGYRRRSRLLCEHRCELVCADVNGDPKASGKGRSSGRWT